MKKNDLTIIVDGVLPDVLTSTDLTSIVQATQSYIKAASTTGEVGLAFVDEARAKTLNKRYANANYATDVLSFSYHSDSKAIDPGLGDIVVCLPIATKQAKQYGISEKSELILLIVHGLLHLCGYDHQTSKEAASLDRMQSDIMKSLKQEYRDFQWSQ